MTGSAEIKVVYEITGPPEAGKVVPSVEPLVKYLRGGGEITRYLRDTLANLLDERGSHALQLILKRRDSRFMKSAEEVDRDCKTYERVQELTNAVPTEDLLQKILKDFPGWEAKTQRSYCLFQRFGITEIKIPTNKPISRNLALLIAAQPKLPREQNS
jgi:hypothetical protein